MNSRTLIPGTWADDGLCNGHPHPDHWHPAQPGTLAPQHREALALCKACPVQTHCLAWALEHGEAGIWGGTTDKERRLLRRAPAVRRDSCGTPSGYQSHVVRNEWTCLRCRVAYRSYQAQQRAEAR